jgi:cbb3-type cytochrome oxidase subunit 3
MLAIVSYRPLIVFIIVTVTGVVYAYRKLRQEHIT